MDEMKRRVKRAAKAMRGYHADRGIDGVVDLVTDLLHLATNKWQANPGYILSVARMHFDAEQSGEERKKI
jgi:hypothetical protein